MREPAKPQYPIGNERCPRVYPIHQASREEHDDPCRQHKIACELSAEDTFPEDIPLADTEPKIRLLAEKVWKSSHANARAAKTVVLKLKTKEFNSLTRSLTLLAPPTSCDELTEIALTLRERVEMGPKQLFRLVGVGLSNFQAAEDQASPLFDEEPVKEQ